RAVSPDHAIAPPLPAAQHPVAPPPGAELEPAAAPVPAPRPAQEPEGNLDDLPVPPDVVPLVMVSFRAPVKLAEELRVMAFETRRPKQDILTDLLAEGLKRWKAARAKRR